MQAARIRADYDALAQLAGEFQRQAGHARQTRQRLHSQMAQLQNGDWAGQGAAAFYQEMDGTVLPALERLTVALENAAQTTARINLLMQQTEADAARLLNAPEGGLSFGVAGAAFETGPPAEPGSGADFGANAIGRAVTALQRLRAQLAQRARDVQAAYDTPHPDHPHNFQAAIDEALKQYGLDPAGTFGRPTYDPDIHSRGRTLNDGSIQIGDGAFILSGRGANISPGFLASTIGHELLHAQQLREGRWVTDPDSEHLMQNNAMSELEAYQWELDHAGQHGLTETERHAIEAERNRFYNELTPENQRRADQGLFTLADPIDTPDANP